MRQIGKLTTSQQQLNIKLPWEKCAWLGTAIEMVERHTEIENPERNGKIKSTSKPEWDDLTVFRKTNYSGKARTNEKLKTTPNSGYAVRFAHPNAFSGSFAYSLALGDSTV